jgi:hypothetical protein
METPEALERQLRDDLRSLGPQLDDDRLVRELYRALTRTRLSRLDREGHFSLSFRRAEELLDGLRAERAEPPLELAQTGGEGEVSHWAAGILQELGWHAEPAETTEHDPTHLWSPEDPPPSPPQDTLAEAHREADLRPPVPRTGTPRRRPPTTGPSAAS